MAERDFSTDVMIPHYQAGRHLCAGVDIYHNVLAERCEKGLLTKAEFPQGFDRNLTRGEVVTAYATRYLESVAAAGVAAMIKPNLQIARDLKRECPAFMERVRDIHHQILNDTALTIDAKIEDIDNSNIGTTNEVFDGVHPTDPNQNGYDADAVTVHVLLGLDALRSTILTRTLHGRGAFALARTSNVPKPDVPFKGARQFQDLWVIEDPRIKPDHQLFEHIAQEVRREQNRNLGIVAGGTSPREAGVLRDTVGPYVHILIPGTGEQGGRIDQVVPLAMRRGQYGVISQSRTLMYPEKVGGETVWQAITRATTEAHMAIVAAQQAA
jgi:orotidine-5'-phosphate decarboxylase